VNVQALSDVVRAFLVLEGGVWADATVLPSVPLDDWLSSAVGEAGFFAFANPGPDRPLSSWFLASTPGNQLVAKWYREVEIFWSKPRVLAEYNGQIIPPNPVASVSANGGAKTNKYPYFWFHYLFDLLCDTDADSARRWKACTKISADAPHRLQNFFNESDQPVREVVAQMLRAAPVHKLNLETDSLSLNRMGISKSVGL